MLKALRRTKAPGDIARAGGELPGFWPQFSITNHVAGGRNPLAIPAYYRGMMHRATVISTLSLHAEVDGSKIDVPIQLLDQPDPAEDRQTTLSRMVISDTLHGEIVAVLGAFDSDGYPQALKVVDPSKCELNDDGTWKIGDRKFSAGEVLHIIPTALPGETRGVSAIKLFRRNITAEIAAIEFQQNFYLGGGQPTTVLSMSDPDVTPEDLQGLLERYRQKVAGGNREPIVLPDTITVQTIGLSNSDSQFLASREFAITDIANMVGVPPYLIGAPGATNVYSNDFEQRRAFLDIYLRGIMYAIERGLSRLLPDGLKVKFDTKSFLRMDPRATVDMLNIQQQWMTEDEVRAVLGMAPLGRVRDGTMSPRELAEALQKIYLSVGTVISSNEARAILNQAGAGLTVPGPDDAAVKLAALPGGSPDAAV